MSCQDCADFQHGDKTSFFRWKNANIEIRACEKHMIEIFDILRAVQLILEHNSEAEGTPGAGE